MKIFKIIIGVIILLFTVVLSFAVINAFRIQIPICSQKIEIGKEGSAGCVAGLFFCFLIYVAVMYVLIKISLKLIRRKKINTDSINEIGIEK